MCNDGTGTVCTNTSKRIARAKERIEVLKTLPNIEAFLRLSVTDNKSNNEKNPCSLFTVPVDGIIR